jgi:type IV secretion system protein VirD4
MKYVSLATTKPAPIPKKTALDPNIVIILICCGVIAILGIAQVIMGNGGKKGKVATARWATEAEIQAGRAEGLKAIAKPKFNRAALYISEPVGCEPELPFAGSSKKVKIRAKGIFAQIHRSILIVGGAGSGKTASVINPLLLSAIAQGFSIFLYDFKFGIGGQSEALIPFALKMGYKVRIFAPGIPCTLSFNLNALIKSSKDLAGAKQIVTVISDNTGESDAKKDNFFDPAGSVILTGAFVMTKWVAEVENDSSLDNILMVNQILNLPNLAARLVANRDRIPPWIYAAFAIIASNHNPQSKSNAEGGIMMTAQKILAPLVLPNYLPAFCGDSSFPCIDPEDPLAVDGKSVVVFGVDKKTRDNTIPIIATCIQQLVSHNLKPGRKAPPVISLDEYASIKLKSALDWIVQERYNGCSILFGIQYREQLEARYGKSWGEGFEANCATKFDLNPGSESAAATLSKTLGEEDVEIETQSTSVNSGKGGGGRSRSTSKQLHRRPLMTSQDITQMSEGECVIRSPGVKGGGKKGLPFRYTFRYDADRADKFEEVNRRNFTKVIKTLEAARAPVNDVDWSERMGDYTAILEKLLPLPEDPQAQSNSSKSKNMLRGSELISKINDKLLISKIQPDRVYEIPPMFMENGVPKFKQSQIVEIIEYNNNINNIGF